MARVTIEDCLSDVADSFELVAITSKRARDIDSGQNPLIFVDKKKKEKSSVIALREIAAGKIDPQIIKENIITSYQKNKSAESSPDILVDSDDIFDISEADFQSSAYEETVGNIRSRNLGYEEAKEMDGVSFEDDNVEARD